MDHDEQANVSKQQVAMLQWHNSAKWCVGTHRATEILRNLDANRLEEVDGRKTLQWLRHRTPSRAMA